MRIDILTLFPEMFDGVMQSSSSWTSEARLPDGVEWHITMEDGKQYRRIFELKHVPGTE